MDIYPLYINLMPVSHILSSPLGVHYAHRHCWRITRAHLRPSCREIRRRFAIREAINEWRYGARSDRDDFLYLHGSFLFPCSSSPFPEFPVYLSFSFFILADPRNPNPYNTVRLILSSTHYERCVRSSWGALTTTTTTTMMTTLLTTSTTYYRSRASASLPLGGALASREKPLFAIPPPTRAPVEPARLRGGVREGASREIAPLVAPRRSPGMSMPSRESRVRPPHKICDPRLLSSLTVTSVHTLLIDLPSKKLSMSLWYYLEICLISRGCASV